MNSEIEQLFPLIREDGYEVKSPVTSNYNCIAWASGDDQRWWWPDSTNPSCFWPADIPADDSIQSFQKLFESQGYAVCPDGDLEEGYDKVAIYAIGENCTHAARQTLDGKWISKLGNAWDIIHYTPSGVEGALYGAVAIFLKRLANIER